MILDQILLFEALAGVMTAAGARRGMLVPEAFLTSVRVHDLALRFDSKPAKPAGWMRLMSLSKKV